MARSSQEEHREAGEAPEPSWNHLPGAPRGTASPPRGALAPIPARAALTVQQQQPLEGTQGQQGSGPGHHRPGAAPGACPSPLQKFAFAPKVWESRRGEGGEGQEPPLVDSS